MKEDQDKFLMHACGIAGLTILSIAIGSAVPQIGMAIFGIGIMIYAATRLGVFSM